MRRGVGGPAGAWNDHPPFRCAIIDRACGIRYPGDPPGRRMPVKGAEVAPVSRQRAFEAFLRGAGPVLARQHGPAFAEEVVAATRREYERLRPEVPDVGGAG